MSIEVMDEKDWVSGNYETAAIIDPSVSTLMGSRNLWFREYHEDGIGAIRGQFLKVNGRQALITQHLQAPGEWYKRTNISVLKSDPAQIEDDVLNVLGAFNLAGHDVVWTCDEIDLLDVQALASKVNMPRRSSFPRLGT
ncbi:MAG TPA: hypothetical protein VIN59_06245 [Alphaproteobacteria bacterium]